MMRVTQAASFVLATVGAFSLSANAQETKKPAATFEIRLAESEPAEGLKPATVEGSKTKIYLHKEASLTAKDVSGAKSIKDDAGKPAVEIVLTDKGGEKLAKATAGHVGKPLAMIVDGKVIFAPVVRSKIEGPKVLVTGHFSDEEAARIVKVVQGK